MSKRKITLKAIAQRAGLSIASVSRVIHTPHLTHRDTQSRINQAISELNFDAKELFKNYHAVNQSNTILVIDNQLIPNSLINHGIEYKAKMEGYKLLYLRFIYFNENEIQQIISYTINHHLDGILIINDSPYLKRLLQFQHALPPIVLINQFSMSLPCIYFDHLSIGYQATEYLLSLGHRNIAILLAEEERNEVYQLFNGYQQALARANIMVNDKLIAYQSVSYSACKTALRTMMSSTQPPSAIICTDCLSLNFLDREQQSNSSSGYSISTESAICGVIDQCRAMKINIPERLSLLQFVHDNSHKPYQPLNHITAIYKPLFEMGEQAMLLLVSMLNCDQPIRLAKMIECELIIRHSTTKLNQ